MEKVIQELILFLLSFIFIFLLYQLIIVRRATKSGRGNRKVKEPFEVTYLVSKYKLDLKKVNYKKLLRVISLVSSLDIALVVSIILLFDNFLLEIVVGFISTLIIIFVSYHLVYLVYKKKGMIKNEF
jgi:hypothetical protein